MDSSRCVGLICSIFVVVVLTSVQTEVKGNEETGFLEVTDLPKLEYYCEDGYRLEGVYCVKTIEKAASRVCQFGQPQGSVCVELYPASKECSPDFSIKGDRCARTDVTLPAPSCPPEYLLDGPRCIRQRQLSKVCPAGSHPVGPLDGDGCELRYPSEARCPPGFEKKQAGKMSMVGRYSSQKYDGSHKTKHGFKYGSKHTKYGGSKYGARKYAASKRGTKIVDTYEVEDYCVKQEYTAPIQVCPEGHSLDPGTSECVRRVRIEPECPVGTTEEADGRCMRSTSAEPRCEPGASLQMGRSVSYRTVGKSKRSSFIAKEEYQKASCLKMEKRGVIARCEDGFQPGPGRTCERVEEFDAVCPQGMIERSGRCALADAAEADCPMGFSVARKGDGSHVCRNIIRVAPMVVCDDGSEAVDENCVRTEPAEMVCPPGAMEEDGVCLVEKAATEWCENGFDLKWGKCTSFERVPARPTCTKDFTLGVGKVGVCEKSKVCEPINVCQKGFREGNRCVEYRPVEPMVSCPSGFTQEWSGNMMQCVQELPKDCSTVEYKVVCRTVPACFDKDCPEEHSSKDSKDMKHPKTSARRGYGYRSEKTKEVCEKQAVPRKRECGRRITADVIKSCPPESVPQGKECMEALYSLPEKQCPMGEYDHSRNLCVKAWKKPVEYSCPDGFEQSYSDYRKKRAFSWKLNHVMCTRAVTLEAGRECEDGWELDSSDRCRKEVAHVCEDGICERKFAVLADFECPRGHELGQDGAGQRFCFRNELTLPTYRCPPGKVVEGSECVEYAEKICLEGERHGDHCDKIIQGRVFDVCMPGFNLANRGGNVCIRVLSVEPVYHCALENGQLSGDVCVKYERMGCPNGQCEQVITERPTVACPEGDWEAEQTRPEAVDWRKSEYALESQGKHKQASRGEVEISCKRTEFAELEHYCSKGQLDKAGQCLKYVHKTCGRDGCAVMEELQPSYVCADGSSPTPAYGGAAKHSSVPQCATISYGDIVYRCGKGEMDATGKACKKITHSKLICPVSFTKRGSMCFKKLAKTPETQYSDYQKA